MFCSSFNAGDFRTVAIKRLQPLFTTHLLFSFFMVFILRFSGAAWIALFLAVLTHPHPLRELINCGIHVKIKAAWKLSLSLFWDGRVRVSRLRSELKSSCHVGFRSNSLKYYKCRGSMTGQTLKKNISAISLRSASAPRTAPWIINNCCLAPDVSFSGPKTLILYDFNRIKSPVESLLWVRQTRRAILSFCSLSAAEFRGLASCCTWRRFSCCLFLFFVCLALVFRVSVQHLCFREFFFLGQTDFWFWLLLCYVLVVSSIFSCFLFFVFFSGRFFLSVPSHPPQICDCVWVSFSLA